MFPVDIIPSFCETRASPAKTVGSSAELRLESRGPSPKGELCLRTVFAGGPGTPLYLAANQRESWKASTEVI